MGSQLRLTKPGISPASPREVIISDEPTVCDKFGTHSRIAEAIYKLVQRAPEHGRRIALTGPWGSGKSTVISLVKELLDKKAGKYVPRPEVFVFDAWMFQGDPLRRCFLERLILFSKDLLVEDEATKTEITEKWIGRLDTITGRKEITKASADKPLDKWAVIFAISLLLIPVAGSFLGKYDRNVEPRLFHSGFVWTALALYLMPVLVGLIAFRKGFSEAARVFIRDLHQDTETTTVKTREASSTDFQGLFGEIAERILSYDRAQRRLVIVIDNLDRVDAANAVSMWTTMRAFFEFDGAEWNRSVWLIVPFDRSALRKLWKPAGDNPAGAKDDAVKETDVLDSFLSKTFQIVFHVSPPLFTELREYFQEQMRSVFDPVEVDKHFDDVYRIYRLLGPSNPAPRDVKTFLNKLSTDWLIWGTQYRKRDLEPAERVLLPCLAVHVLKVDKLAENPADLIKEDFLDVSVTSILIQSLADAKAAIPPSAGGEAEAAFGDWRQQIAAAHFYVPPKEALQPILFGRFSRAFQTGDFAELKEVQDQPYFPVVLKSYADSQHQEWARTPAQLVHVIEFVSQAAERIPEEHLADIWGNLANDAATVESWAPFDDKGLKAIRELLSKHVDPSRLKVMVGSVLRSVSAIGTDASPQAWFEILDHTVEVLSQSRLSDELRGFSISIGDPAFFVSAHLVAIRARRESTAHDILRRTNTRSVAQAFAKIAWRLDLAEFIALREALAASASDFDLLNEAVLDSDDMQISEKLNRLLLRPKQPEAELKSGDLDKLKKLANDDRYEASITAATLILARNSADAKEHRMLREGATSELRIAEIASVLLVWKRGDVMCDEVWWSGLTNGLVPGMLMWALLNGRIAELPLGAVARIFPKLITVFPLLLDDLPKLEAERADLVEALS